ncbi:MAG TPA: 16S rRNA (cytosine(1402)-N(4))-methyltransferase RsmH [Ktedonobacteraceae bacterium]|nr:16S rRNA (cytosine(1402)-N(4))-methyltransferase RsmH [Ktedonobacteraceae bacterium]
MQTQHVPVMLAEVLHFLQPAPGGHYVDGTIGGGGHTAAILARSAPEGRVLGIDTDPQALARVKARLAAEVLQDRLVLAQGNYSEMARLVAQAGFAPVQGIVLDLGFSSDQMENAARGFSFSSDGPLDMRLNQSQGISAADLVNTASEQELADIFWRYGEENRSRQIAWRIIRAREKGAITRTGQLAQLAAAGVPQKPGMIHPATRVFQALRIAVNAELQHLETALPQLLEVLLNSGPEANGQQMGGGRMVIISFHSLEDRLVKGFMRREASDCICPPGIPVCVCNHRARLRLLTSKPVTPTKEEIAINPRARSAKLRAAETLIGL